jgi:hypothetical protein
VVVASDARWFSLEHAEGPLEVLEAPPVADDLFGLSELCAGWVRMASPAVLAATFGSTVKATPALDGMKVLLKSAAGVHLGVLPKGEGAFVFLGCLPPEPLGFRVDPHVPVRSALCQLLVDEVLAWAFERRHGFAARKVFGPYGTPMLAWQNHVEELGGFLNRSMERFSTTLAASRQVPTYSLLRTAYEWNVRRPGLVVLPQDFFYCLGIAMKTMDGSAQQFVGLDVKCLHYFIGNRLDGLLRFFVYIDQGQFLVGDKHIGGKVIQTILCAYNAA